MNAIEKFAAAFVPARRDKPQAASAADGDPTAAHQGM